jgi:hypothetical protein
LPTARRYQSPSRSPERVSTSLSAKVARHLQAASAIAT